METPKITKVELELDAVSGELRVMHDLLNIFANWFEETHKTEYFDELVDRNLLTNFRETAKELGIKPKAFVAWLLEKKFLYRDQKGKLLPR